MKKLLIELVFVMMVVSTAFANNLMIDEKSKMYDYKLALDEINNAITTTATTENDAVRLSIKPFFSHFIMSGESLTFNGLPYSKPKSFVKNNANGYIVLARGKSFATGSYPLAGIELTAVNKKDRPLVIDINNSAIQVLDFYGQPFYTGQFKEQGNFVQPNLIIPPKHTRTVKLFRSDAEFHSTRIMNGVWAGWFLPVRPVNFDNIQAEASFKIDNEYITLSANGSLPKEIQQKYDLEKQLLSK